MPISRGSRLWYFAVFIREDFLWSSGERPDSAECERLIGLFNSRALDGHILKQFKNWMEYHGYVENHRSVKTKLGH